MSCGIVPKLYEDISCVLKAAEFFDTILNLPLDGRQVHYEKHTPRDFDRQIDPNMTSKDFSRNLRAGEGYGVLQGEWRQHQGICYMAYSKSSGIERLAWVNAAPTTNNYDLISKAYRQVTGKDLAPIEQDKAA